MTVSLAIPPFYQYMREKRRSEPSPAQARFKRYHDPASPPILNPVFLLLWTKQQSPYSKLCTNVVKEISAYVTPLYLAGVHSQHFFIVDMYTGKTYLPPCEPPKHLACFQDKNRVALIIRESVLVVELPSVAISSFPHCTSAHSFQHMRFYSDCLYGCMSKIDIGSFLGYFFGLESLTIESLDLKTGKWLAPAQGLRYNDAVKSEVVYKNWWVFFLSFGIMKWFSFEKKCFSKSIQLILPDFNFMAERAQGQLICIGENSELFKVDIEERTIEMLESPKSPFSCPRSLTHMVLGDVLYWVEPLTFVMRSINFKTMVKTSRRLSDKV